MLAPMSKMRFNSPKTIFPDFPIWLWIVFGMTIIALTAPLALKIFQSGEFQHVCKTRKGIPLHLRDWQMYSGYLAYINAFGWSLVASAGACLPFRKIQHYSLFLGLVGFITVLVSYHLVCHN
jgi:hypothetical protein